ncbi:hypothetical protein K466DRAFT_559829 [Polyporus arcularius HHB13444]|uniref:Uncharacterized protein n=1 Tax=Polyporus arcularius HHB13444 TaxID=1314778 RepID=A0A5C3NUD6_9APHY|nr:hypothetical protein K466DRAFT_559829 [Polyporus arcularius HHB13444]
MSISATLPGELLSTIFAHATRPRSEGVAPRLCPCPSDEEFDAVSLFNITHVCRFWRVVALADRALWTDIPHCLSQAQQDAFLQRSRDRPVSLCSRADHSDFADVVNSLPAARIRRLKLVLNSHPRDIAPLMRLRAPILECLTFVSDDERPVDDVLLQRPLLLSGEVVYLKALAVQPAISWIPSNYFPALTHLYLSVLPDQHQHLGAFEILSLLSNTPQLEFVHLKGPEHISVHESSKTALPIALPRLRSLTCYRWAHVQVVKLLSHVTLPEFCRVRLSHNAVDPRYEGYPEPLPQMVPLSGITHLELASSPTRILLVSEGELSGVWLETTMYGGFIWNSWLAGLHAVLPLSNLTSLHINIHCKHTFWPALLSHMSQLTRLDVIVGSSKLGHRRPIDTLCDLLSSSIYRVRTAKSEPDVVATTDARASRGRGMSASSSDHPAESGIRKYRTGLGYWSGARCYALGACSSAPRCRCI